MRCHILPKDLVFVIGDEKKEFVVKADRPHPLKKTIALIIFGVIWTGFTSIFVMAFLWPVFMGREVRFKSNGVPTVAGPDNLGPIIIPAIIISVFALIGLGMLFWGVFSIFKKGGYFVGTPTRLIHCHKGTVRSIDWEQFSGDIEVSSKGEKGNISLQMRTGKMVSRKNGPARYVPDVIYISGIPNVFEVEQICRKRIKENDPTPPAT